MFYWNIRTATPFEQVEARKTTQPPASQPASDPNRPNGGEVGGKQYTPNIGYREAPILRSIIKFIGSILNVRHIGFVSWVIGVEGHIVLHP